MHLDNGLRALNSGGDTLQSVDHFIIRQLTDGIDIGTVKGGHGGGDLHHPQRLICLCHHVNGSEGIACDLGFFRLKILGDLQLQNHGVLRAGAHTVAAEVTQRVGNESAGLFVEFHFLHIEQNFSLSQL